MALDLAQQWIGWLGAAFALATLAVVLWGLALSLRRPKGLTVGRPGLILRGPVYLAKSILYFGLCYLLWIPLPIAPSDAANLTALIIGSALMFPGLALALWGRLTLGRMYNVSSALGAELYADQMLITRGPYAIMRHPMYVGIEMAALGGLLIYQTWTCVFFAVTFIGLAVRARNEEQALAAKFGAVWEDYARHVPAFIPRIRRRGE